MPEQATTRLNWVKAVLTRKTDRLHVQLARYVVVGGVATVADFGTLAVMVSGFGIHYLISNVCGFGAGLLTNYGLSIWWVFGSRTMRSRWAEFLVFGVVGVGGLGVSELCMYVGVDRVGVHYALAKVGAVACTLAWNFGLRKALLFRSPHHAE